MKTLLGRIMAVFFLISALGSSSRGVEYRIGAGLSIHGSDLVNDPGFGGNVLMEVGGRSETGHFLGLHLGYAGFLYNDNKKAVHLGEIGFNSVLNIAPYKPNPFAVLGVGYSFATDASDNGAYFSVGLGWKIPLSEGRQLFIQGAVNLGLNDQKQGLANDPGYLYIPITVGLDFYTP